MTGLAAFDQQDYLRQPRNDEAGKDPSPASEKSSSRNLKVGIVLGLADTFNARQRCPRNAPRSPQEPCESCASNREPRPSSLLDGAQVIPFRPYVACSENESYRHCVVGLPTHLVIARSWRTACLSSPNGLQLVGTSRWRLDRLKPPTRLAPRWRNRLSLGGPRPIDTPRWSNLPPSSLPD